MAPPTAVATAAAEMPAGARATERTYAWSDNPLRDRGAAQPDARQTHQVGNTSHSGQVQPRSTPSLAARALAMQAGGPGPSEPNPVRWTAYQVAGGNAPATINDPSLAPAPQLQAPAPAGQAPQVQAPLEFVPPTLPQTTPQQMPDPLSQPEQAPVPPRTPSAPPSFSPAAPAPSLDIAPPTTAPSVPPKRDSAVSPFDSRLPDNLEKGQASERPDLDADLQKELGKMAQPDELVHCEQFRDHIRNSSLSKVNLNSAPHYGQGLNMGAEEAEKLRQQFAESSEPRQWCDREGRNLITGRLIDLRHEQVVIDVDGVSREIALRDLCDVDLAYIGKAWNLPVSCGTGIDAVAGRNFVPSTVQWKASALCHNPLYFEEVQLERYGHELGPVLQPIVSTVHFFGNIAVLPYKMGIHPPQECQYSLGYYRPGSCAPYMVPPIPISLRGAATQAVAVTGAAAIIP